MIEIFTKTTTKILNVLVNNPLTEYKEIELVNKANTGKGSASTLINSLIKNRILNERRAGKTKLISLNLNNSIAFSIKSVFDQEKLKDIPKIKLTAILLLKKQIKDLCSLIVLFGSTVNNTFTNKSDIDLLIVSNNIPIIEKERNFVEELTGEKFNIHLYQEINPRDNFFQNILTKGIILQGIEFVRELLKSDKDQDNTLFSFYEKLNSAKRNFLKKDYETSKSILETTITQLVFYLLSEYKISYTSKLEAKGLIKELPEGNIISQINKANLKEKLQLFQTLLLGLIEKKVLMGEGL